MIGTRLNHYEILEKIGTGGMGEVYAAEDTKLNRKVALKVLPEDLAADPERRKRFEREATTIAALNHPNIVTIYSVEEADGLHFITMELVEGQALSERIPDTGMTLGQFFDVSMPLVDALDAAHKKGITHRDLKPNNIMVTDEGRVKVLDFGLAKLTEAGVFDPAEAATQIASDQLTEQGQILGTVNYMSPEQAEGRPVDHRSDIFSLGAVMYEMATGECPFKGDTKISIITSIMRDTPQPVSDLNSDLPQHLGRVINRSLAKNVERRYQSTSDVRTELEDLKVEIDTSQMRQSAMDLKDATPRRRNSLAYAGIAAMAVVAIVALALMFGRGDSGGGGSGATTTTSDGKPSLAVLYFDNLSGDQNLDWLRTGLTDMLVTDLSQSPNLRVLGTDRLYQILSEMGRLDDSMTSFDLVQEVASEGQVETVVLGSFARAGETIRISARLQEAATGEIITSETVEGEGEEAIFRLVDDLTQRIKAQFDMPEATVVADVDKDLAEVTTDSVVAYRYYAEGVNEHGAAREREAVPLLERAIEEDPNFAMALAKLAVVHNNIGDMDKAREYSQRAMENLDRLNDRERFYIEGFHYSMDPETTDRSIEAYQKAVDAYPDHTAARNNLAQQLIAQEEFDVAIDHLEELRRHRMPFPGTYESLANAYGRTGRFDRGYEVLQQYTEERPDNAAGHRNLAAFLIWSGRLDEAMEPLDRADELDGGTADSKGLRWQTYVLEDRWDEAEAMADELAAEAENPVARFQSLAGRGALALHVGDLDGARAVMEEFEDLPIDSLRSQGLGFLVGAQLDLGDPAGALETSARMLELAGEDVNARLNALGTRAVAHAALGDADAAETTFEEMWEVVSQIPMPGRLLARREREFRGQLAFYRGDWDEVIAELELATQRRPPNGPRGDTSLLQANYALGVAYFETGRRDDAENSFRSVLQTSARAFEPIRYARSLWYMGRIEEERGNDSEARRFYRLFLERWADSDIDRDKIAHAEAAVERQ